MVRGHQNSLDVSVTPVRDGATSPDGFRGQLGYCCFDPLEGDQPASDKRVPKDPRL